MNQQIPPPPPGFVLVDGPDDEAIPPPPPGFVLVSPGQTSEPRVDPATNQPPGVPEYRPPGVAGYNPQTGEVLPKVDPIGQDIALFTGGLDLPVVGPALKTAPAAAAAALVSPFSDKSYGDIYGDMRGRQETAMAENPGFALTGQLAGTIGAMAPVAATKLGAQALGIAGKNIGTRMAASGATNAAISAADTVARGGDMEDAVGRGLVHGTIGAAIPGLGAGVNAAARAVGNRAGAAINTLRDPAREAARRVGIAMERDTTANPAALMNPADEAAARAANIPLMNIDRGGETVRALGRSVANQSPEARAVMDNMASDRFAGQGARAAEFVKRLTGGNVDDIGFQQAVRETARHFNKPAYERAFSQPGAQQMFSPELQELMQSPAMQRAAAGATTRSANRGAVEGFKAVENPFHRAPDGTMKLRQTADGRLVAPTLRFWDQVKRNLDSEIGKAQRAGDRTYAGDLTALKNKLVSSLDGAVPEYQAARQGAAGFFQAEDALEAGRKFANSPRSIPEARQAFAKFSKTEKDGFAAGYASELIDRIKAAGDRTNVINSTFKSQAAREQMQMVFGPQKMKEIEAYVRAEDIADRLRGALGNSTTVRQLVELGIGGTGGYLTTGDWKGAAAGALVARGGRMIANKAEANVMQQMASILTHDSPGALKSAVHLAKANPKYMQALERLGDFLAIPARAGAIAGGQ
ncbi:hypothetical protein ACTDI4_05500 [Mesorhizobium sp. PUT5]|uniref:hypothetical protein n=1 Tax=Mesorhizobium sp. PUT5 TaxID=3454629 RepID=UPI003FA40EF3